MDRIRRNRRYSGSENSSRCQSQRWPKSLRRAGWSAEKDARCVRTRLVFGLAIVLTTAAAFADVPPVSGADARLNVYVTCDGGDIIGAHLCFAVKEAIITSVGFQLIDQSTDRTGIAVHMVSVDANLARLPKGTISAVSVTYAFFGGPIEYYNGAQVFLVGSKKITDIASSILEAIKKRAMKLGAQAAR